MPTSRSTSPRSTLAALAVVAAGVVLAAPAPASASTVVVAKGAGFGHGVGMSQYGAYGQAKAGRSASQILATYYLGTALTRGDTSRQIRVLLRTGTRVVVRGAATLVGTSRNLSPSAAYVMRYSGGKVTLRTNTTPAR